LDDLQTVRRLVAQNEADFRLIVSENQSTPSVAAKVRDWIASLGAPRVSHVLQTIGIGRWWNS